MLKLFQLNENELIKNSIYIKKNKFFLFIYFGMMVENVKEGLATQKTIFVFFFEK
jgi:hypothetical protein